LSRGVIRISLSLINTLYSIWPKRSIEMKQHRLCLIATAIILTHAGLSYASDRAAVIFPAEGNKTCNDYAANSMILQMGTTSPLASGRLAGPENPRDPDSQGESASYSVTDGKTVAFTDSSTPIDFALLKSSRNISLIIYPSGGVKDDANMKLTVGGIDQTISAISLCYGLGNVAPPPPPEPKPSIIPACEDLVEDSLFDGLQITCPANGERSVIFNFELDGKLFYNTSETPLACVCNNYVEGVPKPLMECDPGAPYDPNDLTNKACPQPVGDKSGAEVTTHIELNNDPYVCSTIGGKRTCYYY